MKEPSYDYDWPEPARSPQYKYLENASFNEYLDLYRDRKDINEQVRIAPWLPSGTGLRVKGFLLELHKMKLRKKNSHLLSELRLIE